MLCCLNLKISGDGTNVEFMLWKIGPTLFLHFIRNQFCLVCKQLMKHTKIATFSLALVWEDLESIL